MLRIGQSFGNGAWVPLLVCLGILAASIDRVPDLPGLRQAAIGTRISHSIAPHVKAHGARFAAIEERAELHVFEPEGAVCLPSSSLAAGRTSARQEADSSPPFLKAG
jgi:hypothetical protein